MTPLGDGVFHRPWPDYTLAGKAGGDAERSIGTHRDCRVDDRYREERVHIIPSVIKEQMARIDVTANLRLVD
jgi:hypothetical protein